MNFESEIKEVNSITREVYIKLPIELISTAKKTELKKLAAKAKIKGFRPGKAPQSMIDSIYAGQVLVDVLNDLTLKSLNQVIEKNNWRIVGRPNVEYKKSEENKEVSPGESDIEFVAKVSLYPQPELNSYDSFQESVERKAITDVDIERVVDEVREKKAKLEPITDRTFAQEGDVVKGKIAFVHVHDEHCGHDHSAESNEEAELHFEPFTCKIGAGRWEKELEKQIVGQEINSFKELEFKPEGENTKLQKFKFELLEINNQILPELTDADIEAFNIPEVTNISSWKERIKVDLGAEEKNSNEATIQNEIIKQLSDRHDFEIPEIMIEEEIRNIVVSEYAKYKQQIKPEEVEIEFFREAYSTVAKDRLKNGILIFALAEKENLRASTQDVNDHIQKYADSLGVSTEVVKNYLYKEGRISNLRNDLTMKNTLEFLVKKAEVSYTEKTEKSA